MQSTFPFVSAEKEKQLIMISPESSPQDERSYGIYTTASGLTCLLISDPSSDKASAAMDGKSLCFTNLEEVEISFFIFSLCYRNITLSPMMYDFNNNIKSSRGPFERSRPYSR